MHDAVASLLRHSAVEPESWRSLWDRLDSGGFSSGEAVALLACLSTRLPDHETLSGFLSTLEERRRPVAPVDWPGSVNIVGTGGGPKTFNISTAAAFVAAAMGVKVVKTGSRAYTSSLGSVDLLERLGITLTRSVERTDASLARYGIAFAGPFVYPPQLARLARLVMPLSMKPFGRFLNAVGPFLADLPVSAQLTGVSASAPLAELRLLAETVKDRRLWLVANSTGADELLGFSENTVFSYPEGGELTLKPTTGGGVEDLAPNEGDPVGHFMSVLAGSAGEVATQTVCLNAAALAVVSGYQENWGVALACAKQAVRGGAATDLVKRMVERDG